MANVTVLGIDEMESVHDGGFVLARKSLGVTAWGMNIERLPAGYDAYPEHDHAEDGQEEVYAVLEGKATLHADGETWELTRGTFARVGSGQKRTITTDEGVTMLVLGGAPGKAYEPRI
jgi:uncharacterized cupin superfamily protein